MPHIGDCCFLFRTGIRVVIYREYYTQAMITQSPFIK